MHYLQVTTQIRMYTCCYVIYVHTDDDLRLNNELFGWPAKIEPMFEVSQLKLASKREEAELALKNRYLL